MSMYVTLLMGAMAATDDSSWQGRSCLEELVSARSVIGRDGHDAPGAIAGELMYDRALIKICTTLGIETGPKRFNVPAHERARLEEALAELGPDWATFMRPLHPPAD